MPKMSKPEKVGFINMLVYGDPGSGKTVLAGSGDGVDELGRTLFLDAEAGKTSLYEFEPDIDTVLIENIQDFQDVYDFLNKHIKLKNIYNGLVNNKNISEKQAFESLAELEADVFSTNRAEPRIYNSVAMDTLTEIQKYIMADIQGLDLKELNLISGDIEMPSLNNWGTNAEVMRAIARSFRNLEIHTILTAHAQDSKDEKTGANYTLPDLPGKLARQIMGFVDIVGYLYTTEAKEEENNDFRNILLTRPKERYPVKDRFDKLGDHIVMPTMEKVYNLINN